MRLHHTAYDWCPDSFCRLRKEVSFLLDFLGGYDGIRCYGRLCSWSSRYRQTVFFSCDRCVKVGAPVFPSLACMVAIVISWLNDQLGARRIYRNHGFCFSSEASPPRPLSCTPVGSRKSFARRSSGFTRSMSCGDSGHGTGDTSMLFFFREWWKLMPFACCSGQE